MDCPPKQAEVTRGGAGRCRGPVGVSSAAPGGRSRGGGTEGRGAGHCGWSSQSGGARGKAGEEGAARLVSPGGSDAEFRFGEPFEELEQEGS